VRIWYSSAAEEEFAESALYYLDESPQAALNFEAIIEEAIASIAKAPNRYPIYEADIRVKVVDTFRFSIYYRVRAGEIQILSIAHQARKPGYWGERL
jgi:plasmid stabilization system protein ParE